MLRIVPGDLGDPRLVELVSAHMTRAHAETEPGSAHALDISGLAAPDIQVWAAWREHALLAVGALKRLGPDHGEIKSMHTLEAARGQGVGSAMLLHIIAAAREAGFTRLSLETGATAYFAPARALYARHGFSACPPFGDYVPDRNSVFMTRDLTAL